MEREIMPDYDSEEFYKYLIPPNVLEGSEKSKERNNHCILFCKKVNENVFDIKKGIAVVNKDRVFFNDGICMITSPAKVVFVME